MKLILIGVLTVASAGLAVAQSDQGTCRDTAARIAAVPAGVPQGTQAARAVALGTRFGVIERIRKHTGIGVAADCIEVRSDSNFRAQGNVALTVGDLVIKADDAVFDEGEIQLTGNARVRLPAR